MPVLKETSSNPFTLDCRADVQMADGGIVTCYGHLHAPVFDVLPFETVSMGDPAGVFVFNFNDRDLMFVNNSNVKHWDFARLLSGQNISEIFGGDAISCSNWTSFPGLENAFYQLGEAQLPRIPFVVDPGDITGATPAEIEDLLGALEALQETFDVVYNGNRQEIRTTAAQLAESFADDHARLDRIRATTGITACVLHARDEAAVATRDERSRVKNFEASDPVRHTGGGDRFTGGLTFGLACGWDWETALACGNACAVGYVESGITLTIDEIISLVQNRAPPGN